MIAATPPPASHACTFSANEIEPRSIRHTAPAAPAQGLSPMPQSTSEPLPVPVAEPSMPTASYPVPDTTAATSLPVPVGTLDCTVTPGAASSTWSLRCEKLASALTLSIAPTDTTESYEAG